MSGRIWPSTQPAAALLTRWPRVCYNQCMETSDGIDSARAYFSRDRFATENGMTLDERDAGHAVCSLVLSERHRNAFGGVMGGAIFTLADFAFAALTNGPGRVTVAQQVSISFLSPAKGERLVATARYRRDGRSSCVVNVDVADESGNDVAQFVGTGFKIR